MKKVVVLVLVFLLVGCSTKIEEEKYTYLEYKSALEEKEEFDSDDKLDFNTFFDITRDSEEVINYSMTIDNPKCDMYNIKALLIHDYTLEDTYPSIGIFDDSTTLKQGSDDKIILKGVIDTIDDISNVKFKLYLEYTDSDGNENKFYYIVNRG